MLVLAAEDYTGASPVQATAAATTSSYYRTRWPPTASLRRVRRRRARPRRRPTTLGVLSHYNAVIWYTGDDVVTREPGWGPGNASRLAMDEMLQCARTSTRAAGSSTPASAPGTSTPRARHPVLRPDGGERAVPSTRRRRRAASRSPASAATASTTSCEYWFGATSLQRRTTGTTGDGDLFDVDGVDNPLNGLPWAFNGATARTNQDHSASFIATSGILPPAQFPQFTSWAAAKYDRPGGPFDPHSGDVLRVLADRRRHLQAADPRRSTCRPAAATVVLDVVRHRAGLGLRVRRGAHGRARTTGRPCPTRTATRAGHRARAARPAGATCTRCWITTRR